MAPQWGERPHAFVVLRDGAKWHGRHAEFSAELKKHAKSRMPGFAVPEWIEIVPELEKTSTGKGTYSSSLYSAPSSRSALPSTSSGSLTSFASQFRRRVSGRSSRSCTGRSEVAVLRCLVQSQPPVSVRTIIRGGFCGGECSRRARILEPKKETAQRSFCLSRFCPRRPLLLTLQGTCPGPTCRARETQRPPEGAHTRQRHASASPGPFWLERGRREGAGTMHKRCLGCDDWRSRGRAGYDAGFWQHFTARSPQQS